MHNAIKTTAATFAILLLALAGCSDDDNPSAPDGGSPLSFDYSFQSSNEGFSGAFTDYPKASEANLELQFERRKLPSGLDSTKYGLYLSGRNQPDDLFMFVKKKLSSADGLKANVVYKVSLEIQIATPEASGCMGAGGAPGEAQTMKAGAMVTEPKPVLKDGFYELNVQKGQQTTGGTDMEVIGHVGNDSGDCSGETWEYKTLKLEDFAVKTDGSAVLWLAAGTDSGYEGINYYYFTDFKVTLTPTDLDSLPGGGNK
ncbi:hypothetical protein LLH00_09075 [bacterium]|nr:hypothetical protein [bacterium]